MPKNRVFQNLDFWVKMTQVFKLLQFLPKIDFSPNFNLKFPPKLKFIKILLYFPRFSKLQLFDEIPNPKISEIHWKIPNTEMIKKFVLCQKIDPFQNGRFLAKIKKFPHTVKTKNHLKSHSKSKQKVPVITRQNFLKFQKSQILEIWKFFIKKIFKISKTPETLSFCPKIEFFKSSILGKNDTTP